MKLTVNECFELNGDYQNQFLGREVFPKPKYSRLRLSKRTINNVRYEDVYILEPLHYYSVTLVEDVSEINEQCVAKLQNAIFSNGLLLSLSIEENKIYIFNASQNIVYLQKGTNIGEVFCHG